jgi:UDP-galactopyranose mutase
MDPFLDQALGYNVSNHAYVVFDEHTTTSKRAILDHLHSIGLHSLGRFGEWEYYNMDICIRQALLLFKRLDA